MYCTPNEKSRCLQFSCCFITITISSKTHQNKMNPNRTMASQDDVERSLLSLPLICLRTAQEMTIHELVSNGKTTVIDLWTVQCTRCPNALDNFNHEASMNSDKNLQFVSICLGGRPDDAREVIEQPSIPRWNNLDGHYQMDYDSKEIMKKILNIKTVPYYVMFDINGKLLSSGTILNMDSLPGRQSITIPQTKTTSSITYSSRINPTNIMIPSKMGIDNCPAAQPTESDSETSMTNYDDDLSITTKMNNVRATSPTRIFEIEDLDF